MFAYCQNNPISFIDSSGHALTPAIAAGIAGGLYGLLSYLLSTPNPTFDGAMLAVGLGAVGAIAGFVAGPADQIMKLIWSGLAGISAAWSAWVTAKEMGGDAEECLSAALNAFVVCGGVTYLCSYFDVSMLPGPAEAAATFDITLLSGFVATGLSNKMVPFFDTIAASLTYAPNYTPTRYTPMRKSGGGGIAGYCVISLSA